MKPRRATKPIEHSGRTIYEMPIGPFRELELEQISPDRLRVNSLAIRRWCVSTRIDHVAILNNPQAVRELIKSWYQRTRSAHGCKNQIAEQWFADAAQPVIPFDQITIETVAPHRIADDAGCTVTTESTKRELLALPSARFMQHIASASVDNLVQLFGSFNYAIAKLTPGHLERPSVKVLVVGMTAPWCGDGGRWLGLFNHLLPGTGRNYTVIASHKIIRSTLREILYLPPSRIIAKPWLDYLEADESAPDLVIVASMEEFEDLRDAMDVLHRIGQKTPILWSTSSETLAEIEGALFRAYGFEVSPIVWIDMDVGAASIPHYFSSVWMRLTSRDAEIVQPTVEQTAALRMVYEDYWSIIRPKRGMSQGLPPAAAAFGLPEQIQLPGETSPRMALMYDRHYEVDVSNGDVIAYGKDTTVRVIPAAIPDTLMQLCPVADGARPSRWETLLWLSKVRRTVDSSLLPAGQKTNELTRGKATRLPAPVSVDPVVDAGDPADQAAAQRADETATPSSEPSAPSPAPLFRLRPRLSTAAGTTPVMAVSASLGSPGMTPQQVFNQTRDAISTWLVEKGFALPESITTSVVIEQPNGEVTIEADGDQIWTLRYDDRRSMEEGAFWRVEATLLGSQSPALGLRVSQIRRRESAPPPQPGAPNVLRAIADQVGLFSCGQPLRSQPWTPAGTNDGNRLLALIENPLRLQPVLVVSVASVVDLADACERLAARLTGTAHVVRIEADIAQMIDTRLGRSRGLHGLMVRIYPPKVSRDSDPFGIPLWTLDSPTINTHLLNTLVSEACAQGLSAVSLDERVPSFQVVRQAIVDGRLARAQQRTQEAHATAGEERERTQLAMAEMSAALATFRTEAQESRVEIVQLHDECERLREERDTAADETRRLRYLLQTVNRRGNEESDDPVPPPACVVYPDTWDGLEEWVAEHCEGRVIVLPQALKAARASSYQDIAFTYRVLEMLAKHYVPMRGRSTDDKQTLETYEAAKAQLGVEIARVGNATRNHRYKHEYRRTFEGKTITMDLHVKRGVGFDPTAIYRLYFAYLEDNMKVVVGTIADHLTNSISH